jgi:Domain of unknown function (DUF4277)
MSVIPHEIEASQVQHLPLVKAYADKIGLVEVIKQLVPPEMMVDPGTLVVGLVLDTFSGRSPLYRLAAFCAQQDTALLLGQVLPAQALTDATVGRVLDRLDEVGTMKRFTAWAVRADQVFGLAKRSVHFDTTSGSGYGAYRPPEDQQEPEVPLTLTHG